MIRITAFKWVPPFAQAHVRDHRLRWMLREAGWPYEVKLTDADQQAARRPSVMAFASKRLHDLEHALGDCDWLVGDALTIADLMTDSVLKIAESLDILGDTPWLAAYQTRGLAQPAYREAIAEQYAFAAHGPKDMKYSRREPVGAG